MSEPIVELDDRAAGALARANHASSSGVWLVTWKKSAGKPRVDYDAAVEEALCFGWVDSKSQAVDDERTSLFFTPRKPASSWSESNVARVEKLEAAGSRCGRVLEAAKRLWPSDYIGLRIPADVTDGNGSSREISASRSSFGGFEQCDLEPQLNPKESNNHMKHSFSALGVSAAVEQALAALGIVEPFYIQSLVLPDALAGRDILAKSPTGSGKTLAFGIPIVERVERDGATPEALVLVPTRELALQVAEEIELVRGAKGVKVGARLRRRAGRSRRRSGSRARTSSSRRRAVSRT